MVIAVFNIGGSHISRGCFNVALSRLIGEEGLTRSVPTNDADPMAGLVHLVRMAKAIHGESRRGLSLAVPNPFDHARGISRMRHKLVSFYGLNLKRILSEESGIPEPDILFVNDADAFLLGAISALDISAGPTVGITLGTGVGSAFADGTKIMLEGEGFRIVARSGNSHMTRAQWRISSQREDWKTTICDGQAIYNPCGRSQTRVAKVKLPHSKCFNPSVWNWLKFCVRSARRLILREFCSAAVSPPRQVCSFLRFFQIVGARSASWLFRREILLRCWERQFGGVLSERPSDRTDE